MKRFLNGWNGVRVLITGGSSGIGRALAIELAGRGTVLTLAARGRAGLERTARDIAKAFPHRPPPAVAACDISDQDAAKRLVEQAVREMGGIDVLVNNAGGGVYGTADRTSVADFRVQLDVHFFGALHCILESLPHMKRNLSGHIVNVASVAALYGVPYLGAYGAAKAALAVLSRSLRAELCEFGIQVTVVYPNYTRTAFFENEKKVGGGRRPDGLYASPRTVARAIVRGIENGDPEIVLSLQGRVLAAIQGVLPRVVDRAMAGIARRLRDPEESSHEQAETADHRPFPESR